MFLQRSAKFPTTLVTILGRGLWTVSETVALRVRGPLKTGFHYVGLPKGPNNFDRHSLSNFLY